MQGVDYLNLYCAKAALAKTGQLYFQYGNSAICEKCSSGLARAIRQKHIRSHIQQVTQKDGARAIKIEEIAETFRAYYADLYNLEKLSDKEREIKRNQVEEYITNYGLHRLSLEQTLELENPITREELVKALKATPKGKAPGPDGFGAEYYKAFQDILGIGGWTAP